MAVRLRNPFYKSLPDLDVKSGSDAITTVATLNGLKYWSGLTAQIFQTIYSTVGRLNLTTVEGQTLAFMRCAPVAAMIGRLAEYSMNGRYSFVDQNDKELNKVSNPLFDITKKPNFLQTWPQFIASVMTYIKLNGQAYVLPITPVGFDVKKARSLFVVPNWMVWPEYTGKNFFQTDMEGVVSGYKVSFLEKIVPADEMIVIRDTIPNVDMNFINRLHEGQSRLYPLGDQINNLIAIQDALYNMTTKRGAMGAWVPENSKDGIGQIMPLKPKEHDDVINAFLKYGTGTKNDAPFNVLNLGMKWVQAAMNVGELKLFEGNEAGIAQLSMSLNVPLFLLGFKDSTFTNLEAAGKACYTSGVIPAVENICISLGQFFELGDIKLRAYFDHLEIFQKSKRDEADALRFMCMGLDIPFKSGVITREEYRHLMSNFMPTGTMFDPVNQEGDTMHPLLAQLTKGPNNE